MIGDYSQQRLAIWANCTLNSTKFIDTLAKESTLLGVRIFARFLQHCQYPAQQLLFPLDGSIGMDIDFFNQLGVSQVPLK